MNASRHLLILAASAECVLDFEYIPSADNTVADALSRGRFHRARQMRPSLQAVPRAVPGALAAYLADPSAGAKHLSGREL